MKLSQTQKLIIAVIIFALAGFILYKSFSGSNPGTVVIPEAMATSTEVQEVVDLTNQINGVSIDLGLFSSPLFVNLVDFNVLPSPEPQGRPDPFADIGNDSGNSIISATSTVLVKQSSK